MLGALVCPLLGFNDARLKLLQLLQLFAEIRFALIDVRLNLELSVAQLLNFGHSDLVSCALGLAFFCHRRLGLSRQASVK